MNTNAKKELLIKALEGNGDVLTLIGRYDEAIDSFQKVASYGKASGLTLTRAKRKIAEIYQKQGKYESALVLLEKAQIFINSDTIEGQLERAKIYILRCGVHRIKGQTERAIRAGAIGLKMIEKLSAVIPEHIKIEHNKIAANGFNSLGAIFWTKGEYNKGIELYQRYLRISEQIGDKRSIGMAYNNLGNVYQEKGKYDKALELYQRCLRILEEIGDKRGIAIASGNLGLVYQSRGAYDKALELYQRYLRISEQIGDKRSIGMASLNLGIIYYEKGEYDKAIELYQKRLRISEQIGDRRGIAIASGNLGNVYKGKGDYNKTIELYQKSLNISKEINDKRSIGIAKDNLGGLFLELGELKKAEKYLLGAEKVLKGIGDRYFLINAFTNLAELKIKQNFIEEALRYIGEALKIAAEMKSKSDKAKVLLLQARILHQGLLRVIRGYKGLSGVVRGTFGADSPWQIADSRFKEAIRLFKELNQPFELAKAYYYYGEALKECRVQFQLDEKEIVRLKSDATKYLQKAKEIFEKIGAKIWLKKVNELWKQM